ncbi:hypothetical protein, partial [Rhizobium sp. EC-SD404]|uniref:hypothetical protein n=1 Tax=Rhizobium sp. EC-SD404 TaxID=2038389 RepID=UPI001AEE0B1E
FDQAMHHLLVAEQANVRLSNTICLMAFRHRRQCPATVKRFCSAVLDLDRALITDALDIETKRYDALQILGELRQLVAGRV